LLASHLKDDSLKQVLAKRWLGRLRDSQAENLDGVARVCRTILIDQIAQLLPTSEVLSLITDGSPAAQSVAAEVLAHRGNLEELGLEIVFDLANHEVFMVRNAAHKLLQTTPERLQQDPSILYSLVESRWDDTRKVATELLRTAVDWTKVDLATAIGLLDSTRADVQDFAIEQVRLNFARFDAAELLFRLVQHPHANMRHFSLELAQTHLPSGADALARLSSFFRTGLFSTWPQRLVKHGIIGLLLRRGLSDRSEAEVAAGILNEFIRVTGEGDFQLALEALTKLNLLYPELNNSVTVATEAVS
jgi:hypothetical protein